MKLLEAVQQFASIGNVVVGGRRILLLVVFGRLLG